MLLEIWIVFSHPCDHSLFLFKMFKEGGEWGAYRYDARLTDNHCSYRVQKKPDGPSEAVFNIWLV